MKIICDKCNYIIDRDKYIGDKLVEEYSNIYGTCCPNCKGFIKPFKELSINDDNDLKMELLKNEMREKLKKNMQGEIKCP